MEKRGYGILSLLPKIRSQLFFYASLNLSSAPPICGINLLTPSANPVVPISACQISISVSLHNLPSAVIKSTVTKISAVNILSSKEFAAAQSTTKRATREQGITTPRYQVVRRQEARMCLLFVLMGAGERETIGAIHQVTLPH